MINTSTIIRGEIGKIIHGCEWIFTLGWAHDKVPTNMTCRSTIVSLPFWIMLSFGLIFSVFSFNWWLLLLMWRILFLQLWASISISSFPIKLLLLLKLSIILLLVIPTIRLIIILLLWYLAVTLGLRLIYELLLRFMPSIIIWRHKLWLLLLIVHRCLLLIPIKWACRRHRVQLLLLHHHMLVWNVWWLVVLLWEELALRHKRRRWCLHKLRLFIKRKLLLKLVGVQIGGVFVVSPV